MFYISVSLNLWSTLQGLKWGLMKHNAFYDLGNVGLGLFLSVNGRVTHNKGIFQQNVLCVVRQPLQLHLVWTRIKLLEAFFCLHIKL